MDLKRQVDEKLHDFVTVYNMIETDCKHILKKTMLLLYLHQRPIDFGGVSRV
jgi:hypothetical protein